MNARHRGRIVAVTAFVAVLATALWGSYAGLGDKLAAGNRMVASNEPRAGSTSPGQASADSRSGRRPPTEPSTPPATKPSKPRASKKPAPRTTSPAPRRTPSPSRPPATQAPKPPPEKSPDPPSREEAAEAEVVRLTNAERAKAGCGPLRDDSRIALAAGRHSSDMAANHYFAHDSQDGRTPWDRMKAAGYAHPSAENIAKGQPSAASVVDSWMNSSGHRANILNCDYKAIGVGVDLRSGGPLWTQDFGFR